jgi:hypothetical protein
MPVIQIWCLPVDQSEGDMRSLCDRIVAAVLSVSELGLTDKKQLTVLFPADRVKREHGEGIVVEIHGLYEKPERTLAVRNKLAAAVGGVLMEAFLDCRVEAFIYSFHPAVNGFWQSG